MQNSPPDRDGHGLRAVGGLELAPDGLNLVLHRAQAVGDFFVPQTLGHPTKHFGVGICNGAENK
jgi:hypothetical protein